MLRVPDERTRKRPCLPCLHQRSRKLSALEPENHRAEPLDGAGHRPPRDICRKLGNFIGTVNMLHEAGYYTQERVERAKQLAIPALLAFEVSPEAAV